MQLGPATCWQLPAQAWVAVVVQARLGNYWAAHTLTCLEQSTIRPRPPSFLSRICPKFSCDLAERFSYVYPKTGLSCTTSCINQSAAARHPLNWIVAQRYPQSRTFFVLATSLLMDRADPSKPCTQRIPTKPRYRSLFKPPELILAYCVTRRSNPLLLLVSVHNALLPTCWRMTCQRLVPSTIARPDSPPVYKPPRTVCLRPIVP